VNNFLGLFGQWDFSEADCFVFKMTFPHDALEGIRCSTVMLLILEDFSSTEWTRSERTFPS
jgi:hypothetical protein